MLKPSFELDLISKGFTSIVGIDEVGRGPWAGPALLGSYCFDIDSKIIDGVDDSKKVTAKKREKISSEVHNSRDRFHIKTIEADEIDNSGVSKAITKGVEEIIAEYSLENHRIYFIIDGIFKIDNLTNVLMANGADGKYYSVALASIIAKVERDRIMTDLAKQYPEYGFEKHKGYGTKQHMDSLMQFGPCAIHRKSYKPIAKLMKQ